MDCLRCGKSFKRKYDLNRHLRKKKICVNTYLNIDRNTIINQYDKYKNDYDIVKQVIDNDLRNMFGKHPQNAENASDLSNFCAPLNPSEGSTTNAPYSCEKCGQIFKHRCNYYTHKRKYCKMNEIENELKQDCLRSQYDLLQKQQKDNISQLASTDDNKTKEDYKELRKKYIKTLIELDAIKNKMEDNQSAAQQNIVNNNNNGNNISGTNNGQIANTGNINNIIINNYGNEDISTINQDVFEQIAGSEFSMIQNMIDYVHVETPCNRNIYIPSTKEKYAMVLQDNRWEIRDKREIIDELIVNNHNLLTKLFDEYKNNLKTIGKERTRQVLEYCGYDSEERVKIKEHIMMNLLNKRYKIRTYYEYVNKKRMNSR
jgi:uncharacterized C2H2 Zn-finger protein